MNPVFQGKGLEVTVLTSCYNAARWLREAIDSILGQTFEDFEFILVDDGSTDGTWDIIRSYHKKDRRIVPIRKPNTGLADSLNVGIANAKGEWIARLDADDLCEPDRLARQLCFAQNHPDVALLGAGFIEIDERGWDVKKHTYPSTHRDLVRNLERLRRFFPHSSAFFRRRIAEDAGFYNTVFRTAQDWDLWLRISERGRIACSNNLLVRVRKHFGQISNAAAGRSQLVYGIAASTCHFLRIQRCSDPSAVGDGTAWKNFLEWIERRMIEENMFDRQKVWVDARADFLAKENRLIGGFHFGTRLLQSGHAGALARKKLFGTSLPKRLAWGWMKRSCAAS